MYVDEDAQRTAHGWKVWVVNSIPPESRQWDPQNLIRKEHYVEYGICVYLNQDIDRPV